MIQFIVASGMLLQLTGAARPNVVVVTADGAPIDSVACRIVNEPDRTATARLRRSPAAIEWTCVPGDRLQCDAPALEPIDLDSASCSKPAARLAFQKSGFATLDVRGPAWIEWRAETARETRLVASRPIEGPTTIPVAAGGRIIRVYRGQSSPVSAHVVPNTRVQIESPKGGGELFGRIVQKGISPLRVAINGAFETEIPIDPAGRFGLAGFPPGDYQVAPVYAGGIKRAAKRIRIDSAKTAELAGLISESVGGVMLVIAPEVCDSTSRLALTRVETRAQSASFEHAFRGSLSDGCEWHLEGLKPGRYEATVTAAGSNDLKAADDFLVETDRLAWANLGEPQVIVEGRVTLGDKPGANLLLAFERANASGRLWVTQTHGDGAYRLAVDRPGAYAVEVRAARRLGAESHLARLQAGVNRFDLKLSETRLTVKLQRADRRSIDEIVQVHITGGAKDRSGIVLPDEGNALDFAGVPYGDYVITADTSSGMVSVQPGTVSISKNTPAANVTVTLASNIGELRLITGDRNPVSGARVQVNALILSEITPGVFELKSASPGTEMLISAPGLIPICHVLTANDFPLSTLVMSRGAHAVEINFTPRISGPLGEITGLPGSTCPVPLGITTFGATEDATSTTVRILGLPEGRFSYSPTRVTPAQIMEVPGPPLKFTKPRQQF